MTIWPVLFMPAISVLQYRNSTQASLDGQQEKVIETMATPASGSQATRAGSAIPAPLRAVWTGLRTVLSRLLAYGTESYPPRVARRLKILNGMAWLIVVTSLQYVVTFAAADFERYQPFVWLNAGLVVMGLSVPFLNKVHELAGGLLIAVTEITALFLFTGMLGRDSGTQINLIIGAAAPFFIFGLQRKVLAGSIILVAFATHIASWFMFPPEKAWIGADKYLLDQLYLSAVFTSFIIIGAIVYYAYSLAERAEGALDQLLRNTLPSPIVDRLQSAPGETVSDSFDNVSILFTDLAGFVGISKQLGSAATVILLNDMVSRFDTLAHMHGIEKIKTIGDAYMAGAGLPVACPDHAIRVLRFAIAIRKASRETGHAFNIDLPMRIGIACGPAMAGIIGTQKFTYDVWGDPVNLAARLESAGAPGEILVSADIRELAGGSFAFSRKRHIDIKGFGPTEVWNLDGAVAEPQGDHA